MQKAADGLDRRLFIKWDILYFTLVTQIHARVPAQAHNNEFWIHGD